MYNITDVVRKHIRDGKKILKNDVNKSILFCHIIRVVISPKGLNAPPALAATTVLIQHIFINLLSLLKDVITEHIIKAVVKLSAIGDKKNDNIPVNQYIFLYDSFFLIIIDFNSSNIFLSFMEFIYVIVTKRNKNNSAYSNILFLIKLDIVFIVFVFIDIIEAILHIKPEAIMTNFDLSIFINSSSNTSIYAIINIIKISSFR